MTVTKFNKYTNINKLNKTSEDLNYLYSNLNNRQLRIINRIVKAFNAKKITLDRRGVKLIINDSTYDSDGSEKLVLKWILNKTSTESVVEFFNLTKFLLKY